MGRTQTAPALTPSAGPPTELSQLEGTYRGFAPTDESAVAAGEIEIVVKGGFIRVRMATGLAVDEDEMSVADFRLMNSEELVANFNEGYEDDGSIIGFRPYNDENPQLLFISQEPGAAWECSRLWVVTGGMGEMLGMTLLCSPSALARGDYEKALQEFGPPGTVPSLANGGRASGGRHV